MDRQTVSDHNSSLSTPCSGELKTHPIVVTLGNCIQQLKKLISASLLTNEQ